jgi:hypothetical protein
MPTLVRRYAGLSVLPSEFHRKAVPELHTAGSANFHGIRVVSIDGRAAINEEGSDPGTNSSVHGECWEPSEDALPPSVRCSSPIANEVPK